MSIATRHLVIPEQKVMCKMPLFDQGRGFILIHPGLDLSLPHEYTGQLEPASITMQHSAKQRVESEQLQKH